MDFAATLAQIEALPIDDRIRLVHAIWDGIAAETDAVVPTEAQKRELDRRIAEHEANPDDVLSRDEVMSWLRSQP